MLPGFWIEELHRFEEHRNAHAHTDGQGYFEVVRIVGKGGMGTVYLARDSKLDRLVAIKVLQVGEFSADDRRARFLREARTAAAIRHPNVATIYEVGENDGLPYIVMEYCEGETLAQRIRRRPLEPAEFLHIATQIAAILASRAEQPEGLLLTRLDPAQFATAWSQFMAGYRKHFRAGGLIAANTFAVLRRGASSVELWSAGKD